MKPLICIDTNILIRFLLADHPQLSPKARQIFLSAQDGKSRIYLDETIVAETVWVLTSFYKQNKGEIVSRLLELISQPWVINPRKKIILESLSLFSTNNLAFIDCWVYCVSKEISGELVTFDKKLEKLSKFTN